MFVVLAVTGNAGRVVAETLLAKKKVVRVVLHGEGDAGGGGRGGRTGLRLPSPTLKIAPRSATPWVARKERMSFCPRLSTPARSEQTTIAVRRTIAAAIATAGVRHVVMLPSIGAQHPDGTGPILSVHDADATFSRTRAAVTFLRAAYFMENWGGSLYALGQDILPTFLLSAMAIPIVATRDIGLAAARLLVEGGSSKRVIEQVGPREHSPRDVAAALGRVVGRPIVAQQEPEDAKAAALMGTGVNAEWARLFHEVTHGFNASRVAWEGGHSLTRGKTDVEAVLASLVGGSDGRASRADASHQALEPYLRGHPGGVAYR